MANITPRPLYRPDKTPIQIEYKAGWPQSQYESVGEDKKTFSTGIRTSDSQACDLVAIRTTLPWKNSTHITSKRVKSLYAFFWVIPRRLNFICRRFGTLLHFNRQVGVELPRRKHTTFRTQRKFEIRNTRKSFFSTEWTAPKYDNQW